VTHLFLLQEIETKVRPEEIELIRRDFSANGSWETFLSYEDPMSDVLVGLLRLRKQGPKTWRKELKGDVSMVRELHVYGQVCLCVCEDVKASLSSPLLQT